MSGLDNRIPPPVLVLVMGIAMYATAQFTPRLPVDPIIRWLAAAALLSIGFLTLAAGFRAFRRMGTTINPVDPGAATRLVTTGIYRRTRNPMYVGFTLMLLAVSVGLSAPWTMMGPALFCAYIDRFQIVPEENALLRKFGSGYRHYCANVRRWI